MIEAIQFILHRRSAKQSTIPLFEMVVGGLAANLPQMAAHRPHVGVDGHAVVIQNHDQRLLGGSGVVQPLIGESAGQRPVPDQGQYTVILFLQRSCPSHSQRHRDRVGGMARDKRVVLTLIGLRKPGKTAELPQGAKQFPPPGKRFVNIALVSHVEHQPVVRSVKHAVDGHRQFYYSQIGG
ncbi:hypothetical protein DSECCO2_266720 [anaerobic digester metagenome]